LDTLFDVSQRFTFSLDDRPFLENSLRVEETEDTHPAVEFLQNLDKTEFNNLRKYVEGKTTRLNKGDIEIAEENLELLKNIYYGHEVIDLELPFG
jgi:hypothetical protein